MAVLTSDQMFVVMALLGGLLGFMAQRLFGLSARVAVLEARLEAWEAGMTEIRQSLKELCKEVHALRVEMVGGRRGKGYNPTEGGAGA